MSTTSQKSPQKTDNSNIIRFRAPKSLGKRLRTIAKKKDTGFPEFMREKLRAIATTEEQTLGITAKSN